MGVIPCQFDSDLSNLERQLLVKEAPSTEGALLFKRHDVKASTTTWYWPRRSPAGTGSDSRGMESGDRDAEESESY